MCKFFPDGDSSTDENSIDKNIADEHNIADEDRIADDRIADDRIADDRIADEKIVDDEENSMAKQYKFPLRNRKWEIYVKLTSFSASAAAMIYPAMAAQ